MIVKYFIPAVSACGLLFAVSTVLQGRKSVDSPPPLVEPARAPYGSYVAGAGIVESSSEDINVGAPFGGIVESVHVTAGQRVDAGAPLFELDARQAEAELGVREAALLSAREALSRLKSLPRPEDVPVAEARVTEAEAALADARNQLALVEKVTDRRAVSQDTLERRRYAVRVAEAQLRQVKASLNLLKAGSWEADLRVAEAELVAAEAQVRAARTELERHTIRAPVPGEVLRVKVRPGEFAPAGAASPPLLTMGKTNLLHVRVDVDENDAWRVRPNAAAIAYLRGNRGYSAPLGFVRFEPYVVPKRSLTGESTERVDTRVLQILYSFRPEDLPAYVGQLVDVFIEAPPVSSAVAGSERREER